MPELKAKVSTTKAITIPAVHLNGSSASSLLEGYRDAYAAVNDALAKLAATGPHPRDYYVQDAGRVPTELSVWQHAQDEHLARTEALRGVLNELLALYQGVERQQR